MVLLHLNLYILVEVIGAGICNVAQAHLKCAV